MEVAKAQPRQAAHVNEASKRLAERTQATAKPDAMAAKKAYEPPAHPITNTRGEVLGQHINLTA